MNREQKALLFVIVTLLLVIVGFLGGTYYLWRETRLPKSPVIAFEKNSNEEQDVGVKTSTAYLYYFDPKQDSLVRVPVTLSLPARTGNFDQRLHLAWDQMTVPPSGQGLVSTIPAGGAIDTLFVDSAERCLYLGLNEEFFLNHPGGAIEGWATLYSIVNTASGLSPLVDRVMLLRQGRVIREGPGGWDCSRPYEPDETRVRAFQAEPL